MKLKHYIKKLQEIEKDFPDATMIYSHKGGYFKVANPPTEGRFKEGEPLWEDEFKTGEGITKVNAVLLN